MDSSPIPFIDVAAQRKRLGKAIDDAIARVLGPLPVHPRARGARRSKPISAAFCGARHAITCASGTDALAAAADGEGHRPWRRGVHAGIHVLRNREVAALVGATPVLVDVEEGASTSIRRASPVRSRSRRSSASSRRR
jgi:dTDP-4-amino-4,6-dideoxygalactose transaminase